MVSSIVSQRVCGIVVTIEFDINLKDHPKVDQPQTHTIKLKFYQPFVSLLFHKYF